MINPLPNGFTHLSVHSNYSLLRATASVPDLVNRAVQAGFQAIALTDTNGLYGAVELRNSCRKAGLKPMLGLSISIKPQTEQASPAEPIIGNLTLLACNRTGYQSLCKISTALLADPDRIGSGRPVLTWEELERFREGLVCIEGGRSGRLEYFLRSDRTEAADHHLGKLRDLFPESSFVALEIHKPEDAALAEEIIRTGARHGLYPVAVQPVFCLEKQEREILRLLTAIRCNTSILEVAASALPGQGDPEVDIHWLKNSIMADRFIDFPEALERVEEVVERCEDVVPDGSPIWPDLKLPGDQSADDALEDLALQGLNRLFASNTIEDLKDRLNYELRAIAERGFAPLFLVVSDIAKFARQKEIPINTRGSVANSLVAYSLGITQVDPIEHDLLFERFLNPARIDLPDIDLDFCSRRRDEVLEYVRDTYGPDQTALVATINTLQPKSAVRETAKAFGYDESRIKHLTGRLPRTWHPDPRRRSKRTLDDLIQELDDESDRKVVRLGYQIVGQPRHLSVHPGGVVITPGPLTDFLPLQMAPKGFLITQFDHQDVESLGLPKIDLLGIRALTVVADTAELVRRNHDPNFRVESIPGEDEKTGTILSMGETIGVFQCESEGSQRTLRKLRARQVADLAIANAFFKPGPATGGMAGAFVRRYRGEEEVTYLHPALEPILRRTKGVLIFQEQVLRIVREIAGLSWQAADQIRRGISKFQSDELEALRTQFLDGCRTPPPSGPGFTPGQADQLWEQVRAFAGYGFNQGHATAYADVSYRSAYLKAHWPAAFLAARLAGRGGYHNPAVYIAEAVRLGIQVRPPHVNHSLRRFTLAYETSSTGNEISVLWMGLGHVRDLRNRSIQRIIEEREVRRFDDLRDFSARVPSQRKETLHLIQCGAFDGLGSSRAGMVGEVERAVKSGSAYQQSFDFVAEPDVPTEDLAQRLAWELFLLGMPVSGSPVSLFASPRDGITALRTLPNLVNQPVEVLGIRLPGWTGGSGFFLSDGDTFINVKLEEITSSKSLELEPWKLLRLKGRWVEDEWGGGWFQAREIIRIDAPSLERR